MVQYVNVQGGTPTVSNWHFIVCTYDGSNIKLYVDGSYIGQTAASGNIAGAAGATYLGAYNKANDHYLNGKIDEVSIWNSALSSNEVSALYNSGNGLPSNSNSGNYTSSNNLQLYYNFNEGSGTSLTDQSSNSHNGTVNGASWGTGNGDNGAPTVTNVTSTTSDGTLK